MLAGLTPRRRRAERDGGARFSPYTGMHRAFGTRRLS